MTTRRHCHHDTGPNRDIRRGPAPTRTSMSPQRSTPRGGWGTPLSSQPTPTATQICWAGSARTAVSRASALRAPARTAPASPAISQPPTSTWSRASRPNRPTRRRRANTDAVDAEAAARAALNGQAAAVPKSADGPVEAIRMLSVARRSAVKSRTQAANQIAGLIVTAGEHLKDRPAGHSTASLVETCTRWRPGPQPRPRHRRRHHRPAVPSVMFV